jgi:hypothetical protein
MPSWRPCTSRGDMAPASGHQWLVTITRLGRGRIGHMALSPWCTPRASKCTSTSSLRVWDGLFQLGEFGTTDCVFGSGSLPYRGLHSLRAQRRHNRLLVLWTKTASTSRSPMLAYTRDRSGPSMSRLPRHLPLDPARGFTTASLKNTGVIPCTFCSRSAVE